MARLGPPSLGLPQGRPPRQRGKKQDRVGEAIAMREGWGSVAGPGRVAGSTQSRGGRNPDTTKPEDIAAALAIAGAGMGMRAVLAREVFAFRWWPQSTQLAGPRLRRDIYVYLVVPEFKRREMAISAAKLDLHIAEVDHKPNLTDQAGRRVLAGAKVAVDTAVALKWPNVDEQYLDVIGAAMTELARAPLCETCAGHGFVMMEKHTECPVCHGGCTEPLSARRRAIACKLSNTGFQKVWLPVYGWILRELIALDREFFGLFLVALDAAGGRD
jgi:hypothetical protein